MTLNLTGIYGLQLQWLDNSGSPFYFDSSSFAGITVSNPGGGSPTITLDPISSDDIVNADEADTQLSVTGVTTDIADGETITVSIGGVDYTALVSNNRFEATVSPLAIAALGEGTVDVRANGANAPEASASFTIDTLAPAVSIAAGVAGDNTINASEKTAGVTLTGATEAGSTVLLSIGGQTRAAAVSGTTWSYTLQADDYANMGEGAETITVTATDAAGNVSPANDRSITIDTLRPTVTVGLSDMELEVGETATVTFTFSEAVTGFDKNDVTVQNGTLSDLTVSADGKTYTGTFTPTAAIEDATNLITVGTTWSDAAGNAPTASTASDNYAIDTLVIDGVDADRTITTHPDGSTSQDVTIPVVTQERQEQTGNRTAADIPLVTDSNGREILTALLPVGFGLNVTGSTGPRSVGTSLTDLVRAIQSLTEDGSAEQSQLTSGGSGFLQGLPTDTPLLVQTITPTVASGSSAPTQPLVISGTATSNGEPKTALVIDSRGLPSGSVIQLENVDFAAVIGAVRITGGTGSQSVWGDSADQYIVLGADDDILHGGDGNDYVGSLGGDDQLFGDGGHDTVSGGEGNDQLFGGDGIDLLLGGVGNDRLDGGADGDRMIGGTGDDVYYVNHIGDTAYERRGEGTDTVIASENFALRSYVEKLILTGDAVLGVGNSLHNTIKGSAKGNVLLGGGGNDYIRGEGGNDKVKGDSGNDRLYGHDGNDRLHGGIGNDRFRGGDGNDALYGDKGKDVLYGNDGNDVLYGGSGFDKLIGGKGADIFRFRAINQSSEENGRVDVVYDFSSRQKDTIDLKGIDADFTVSGNQRFTFIGNADFSLKAGELRYEKVKGGSYVYGDVNGDGEADFGIFLKKVSSVTEGDFFL